MKKDLRPDIWSVIAAYGRIIIHRHQSPDGDAIGAQVGLKHIIQENYPDKEVYTVGDSAGRYAFMDDAVMDDIPDSRYEGALAVILDTGSAALISDTRYTLAADTLRIDHHLFCEPIARVEVVEPGYESCCGLITALAVEAGLKIPPLAAKSLFTGIVTDSGRFRYDSVTPETFRLAACLLEQSFNPGEIYRNLYSDDLDAVKVRAAFVQKIELTTHGVAYIYTTKEEMVALGMSTFAVSRGMVNTMADIRGVNIWVNFTETEDGVLCELRSGTCNINPVAVRYGGGGHPKASGATVKDRDTAMAMLNDLDALSGQASPKKGK